MVRVAVGGSKAERLDVSHNDDWVVVELISAWGLFCVCLIGHVFKFPPSSLSSFSQNWVLDRRWQVFLLKTLKIIVCFMRVLF